MTTSRLLKRSLAGDKQKKGTIRRNERQWSAVSIEEINEIESAMNLENVIDASTLGANLCLSGIANLSALPKGSLLKFSSGVELLVEEYNPPCLEMGKKLAELIWIDSTNLLKILLFLKPLN